MSLPPTDLVIVPVTQLGYAPRPPLHRRRRFRRVLGVTLLLIASAAGVRWGRVVARQAALLYHQRCCMTYVAPADQVAFDSDAARVAALMGNRDFVIARGCAFRRPPHAWTALAAVLPGYAAGSPRAPIFLHARRPRGGGRPRLVAVERAAAGDASALFIRGYDIATSVIEPARLTSAGRVVPVCYALDVVDSFGPHHTRIYAGQPDPADESHFTVVFETNGKRRVADGYLAADGRVEMTVRP